MLVKLIVTNCPRGNKPLGGTNMFRKIVNKHFVYIHGFGVQNTFFWGGGGGLRPGSVL